MIANYHTHTPLCRHAEGTEAEYAQAAAEGGLKILGFSDHTPYWFPEGYYTHMRMYPEQLAEYCDAVQKVRKEYEGRLQIHLGLEVEYYPAFFEDMRQRVKDYGIEYFLLGQHWSGDEMGQPYNGNASADEAFLRRYCKQVAQAMNTGYFTYLAHPDLLHFVGDDKVYERYMRSLCQEANGCGLPVEINLWGLQCNKHYPDQRFWRIAAEENCKCVIGCDAHAPWAVPNAPKLQLAMEIVRQYDLDLLDTVQLRPID